MGKLSLEALHLLKYISVDGVLVDHGQQSAVDELLAHSYVVRVFGDVYVITRAGRLVATGHDAPER